jgi:hypothetical protein
MSKKVIYICAVLMLQGIRKKPFESGEEVTPENFPAEHFDKLVREGFIVEKPEETNEAKAKREASESAVAAEAASAEAANKAEVAAQAEKDAAAKKAADDAAAAEAAKAEEEAAAKAGKKK